MKSRSKVLCLAAAALLLVPSFPVRAEDRQGASGWQVTFNGKSMDSNFTSGKMSDEVNAMQPGDSVELTVTIKNVFDGQADWYMKNEVLESLEDAGDAAGGAYDYLLTYTDISGRTTTLYSSEKFGGEGRIGGVGLHGATTTLKDYFYLDRMGDGDSGTVKLKVALDGETLVNDYQNTLARLQMDFATELVTSGTTPRRPGGGGENPQEPGEPANEQSLRRTGVVQTNDDSQIMRYLLLMFGSGSALLLIGIWMLGRQKEEAKARKDGEGRETA